MEWCGCEHIILMGWWTGANPLAKHETNAWCGFCLPSCLSGWFSNVFFVFLSRPAKVLWFYPNFKVTSYLAVASWVFSESLRLWESSVRRTSSRGLCLSSWEVISESLVWVMRLKCLCLLAGTGSWQANNTIHCGGFALCCFSWASGDLKMEVTMEGLIHIYIVEFPERRWTSQPRGISEVSTWSSRDSLTSWERALETPRQSLTAVKGAT